MPLRYRRAKPEDIPRALSLLKPERPLFSDSTWAALPHLIADLLERERIGLWVIEESKSHELRYVGGSGFLNPVFLQTALDRPEETILEQAFAAELEHRPAFLNVKQVAEANRKADLRLLIFYGALGELVPSDPKASVEQGLLLEGWYFFHEGFQLREIWVSTADAVHAELLSGMSFRLVRQRATQAGVPTWLFTVSREDALRNPGAWPCRAMLCPTPILGFTRTQQKLLELALLDRSDRDAACDLQISPDAVKKRWRSIYERVSRVEPELLAQNHNGPDRRRILLQRLRSNLEELRPY